MKIAIYSDVHYSTAELTNKNRRPSLSAKKIPLLNEIFRKNNVDAVFCLGDIINSEKDRDRDIGNLSYIMGLMKECGLPLCTIPGNHDFETLSQDEYYSASKCPRPPYYVDIQGSRFVFLDCCYINEHTEYDRGNFDWKVSYLPKSQLDYLKNIASQSERVYVCTHQNLDDRDDPHCIRNAESVREVISECESIKGVFSGHYHKGAEFYIDGIKYITPSALCEGEELSYLIIELI